MAAGYIFLVVLLLGVLYLLLIRPEKRNAEMAVYRRTMFAHRGYHNKEKLIPENSMACISGSSRSWLWYRTGYTYYQRWKSGGIS